MKTGLVLIAVGAALLLGTGCGSSSEPSSSEAASKATAAQLRAQRHARHMAKKQRTARRHRAKIRTRKAAAHQRAQRQHRLELRQQHQAEAKARKVALIEEREQRQAEKVEAEAPEEGASECDPNYSGACLDPNASDYDCEGGSGNGPDYTGEVTVVGVDHYGLDADGDGVGCENE
jgi:hypothetical protein